MTRSAGQRQDFARTAGPRLRCFLGWAVGVLLVCFAACGVLQAQLQMPKPIRLTNVEGYVANTHGKPVVNAEVTLVQDGKVVYTTRTDADGAFHFERVAGEYTFRVGRTEFAPAEQQIVVTEEIVTALKRRKLYVIVGPGACQDACSQVFTSEREFDKTLKKLSRGKGK